ncbi:MAG: hypothetical protein V5A62_17720 [Haloarculaceae archaeon]
MSLDIGAAISEGVDRLLSRDGLVLVGAFLVVGVLSSVATQSLTVGLSEALLEFAQSPDAPPGTDVEPFREQVRQSRGGSPLAVDISAGAAFGLVFVLGILAEALRIVTVRTFYATAGERPENLTRGLAFATANGFLGGIVVSVLVGIGLVFLVVPGVFLALALFFVRQEIAVEDRNFVDAMAESWALTRGNRLNLLGLVAVLLVVGFVAFLPTVAASVAGASTASVVVGAVVSPLVTVFGIAATTRAYAQLKAEDGSDEPDESDEPETVGALGPDDLPEP